MSGTITTITTRTPNTLSRNRIRSLFMLPVLSMAAWTLGAPNSVLAAQFDVSGGDAAGLIQAIADANANSEADVIHLAAGTYTLTDVASEQIDLLKYTDPDGKVTYFDDAIYGPNGLPLITSEITIKGAGGAIIERSSSERFRFLHVRPDGVLRLEGVTLRGGHSLMGFLPDGNNDNGRLHGIRGGAILNQLR